MLIFFIRHGETVDNVAGIYAGVRDSELTNHGILQARQLGDCLKQSRCFIRLILASPLQRARRTAEAILDAQSKTQHASAAGCTTSPDQRSTRLVKTPLIIEQDFGFYEGKPFYARSADSQRTGKAAHYDKHKQDPGFQDVETAESMAKRCDKFLDEFLLPAVHEDCVEDTGVAVVAHGIILSHLWRRFLLRLSKRSITIAPEVTAAKGQIILEHLGGWSNTGFLEVQLLRKKLVGGNSMQAAASVTAQAARQDQLGADSISAPDDNAALAQVQAVPGSPLLASPVPTSTEAVADPTIPDLDSQSMPPPQKTLCDYDITILTVNGQEHLKGVKRARGGIGSAKFDEGQKSLHSFFKRAKK
ncbi:2,3-bisphosphoglycerate-dependent phosphoglycerate mutase [Elsinoe australis]|uniref:2,3-bisphosphoglycerate-dependent phosphoglycerate mutase n=1 Tax=Elsinoe australis TaxID=40998 RepID=A0A2P7YVT2_9PEZI|nr:2,3-bisphosphoglycerate-dependent phosphoglycerate mutase [Elsinoe australis]